LGGEDIMSSIDFNYSAEAEDSASENQMETDVNENKSESLTKFLIVSSLLIMLGVLLLTTVMM